MQTIRPKWWLLLHRALVAAGLLPAAAILNAAQQATPSFRADVQLVGVSLTVRDRATGRPVSGLTKDDFIAIEDGAPQPIAFFAPSADLPLSLGLLVDASGSQEEFIKDHRRDLSAFLKAVMKPQDQAFVLAFGNRLRLLADFTPSAEVLVDSLDDKKRNKSEAPQIGPRERRVHGTAFYDAIVHGIGEKMAGAEQQRKGLVIFSDGEDNASAHHLLDAIEAAQAADVPIFAIRYTDRGKDGELTPRNKYGASVMTRIARETGGVDYDASNRELRAAFQAIGDELHASYELAYKSTNTERDGAFRRIVIRPKQGDVVVRHKTGYWAR